MLSPLPRIIFAGTPDFAVASLEALLQSEVDIVGVYTQPDRKAGRGKKLQVSPVKQCALSHNLSVFQPDNFKKTSDRQQLQSLNADLMVVTAYGLILPQKVLDLPRLGCVNVHASLLPRWRGAAPIQRAIEAGDKHSGVCLMQMQKGLDTGPVLFRETLSIGEDETGGQLHDRLAKLGKQMLLDHLSALLTGIAPAKAQDEQGISYAHKLTKQETRLDWSQPAAALRNKVRAFNPWPVATINVCDQPLRVLQASCDDNQTKQAVGTVTAINESGIAVQTGRGQLRLQQLQKPGGKVLSHKDLLNGFVLEIGAHFE